MKSGVITVQSSTPEVKQVSNLPSAAMDADGQRTYLRSELEDVWLQNSGGTVYRIYSETVITLKGMP